MSMIPESVRRMETDLRVPGVQQVPAIRFDLLGTCPRILCRRSLDLEASSRKFRWFLVCVPYDRYCFRLPFIVLLRELWVETHRCHAFLNKYIKLSQLLI